MRLLKDPAATLADDSLLVLRIPVTPACRIGERGTAECILNVLRSVAKIPVHLETLFEGNVFRVAESDEDAACLRAERIIPGERDRVWSDSGLHVICAAHKLHSSAVKTWHLFPSCLTGMVHVYKCLQDSDLLDVVRRKAIGAIETKLQIFKTGVPPEPAEHFKRHMMRLFLPSRRKPRRYAIIWHLSEFLNGDWRARGCLQHYCYGSCCLNRQESVKKLQAWLVQWILPHKRDFNKTNWKTWHEGMALFGWAGGLHHFLGDILREVFGSRQTNDGDDNDAGARVDAGDVVVDNPEEVAPGREARAAHNMLDDVEVARQEKARSFQIAREYLEGLSFATSGQ